MSYVSKSANVHETVKIGRFCIIEDGAVLEQGVTLGDYVLVQCNANIGKNTKINSYTKVGAEATIGENCNFTCYCEIREKCKLGNNVTMGSRCTLSAGTVIEDNVVMKYSFVVTDTPDLNKNNEKQTGYIKAGAKFGASVVIMPNVTIGRNAEIGACSQVRKSVPDDEVWFGIPAKFYR
jgi:UDP-2-acetamido-3-amino-2,3-dideoxy-glucuronate N-acetyltransferase